MCIRCKIVDQFPSFDEARAFLKKLQEELPMCSHCVDRVIADGEPIHLICSHSERERQRLYREAEISEKVQKLVEFQMRLREDPVFFRKYVGAMN